MSDFDRNPIKEKAIAKECQDLFCLGNAGLMMLQYAINRNGKVIHQTVSIKDFNGNVHYSRIILN